MPENDLTASIPAPTAQTGSHSPGDDQPDVIIVGAGVVGATMAMQAARRGLSTVVLEAASAIGAGCSYANAALLAPDHVAPLATPKAMGDAAAQMLRRPSALRVNPDPRLVPFLSKLAASALPKRAATATSQLRELARESAAEHARMHTDGLSSTHRVIGAVDVWLRTDHLPQGALTPEQIRAIEPTVGAVAGGLHHPDEAITESRTYVREMLDAARAAGAQVRFDSPVLGLERTPGRVRGVHLADGVLRGGHVIVCTGLDAGQLSEQVGVRMPLRGGRGYVIDLAQSEETPTSAVRFAEHRVVVTPLADRVRVAGYMEFGAEGRPVDLDRARKLVEVTARGIPAMSSRPVLDVWSGERPCTSDGMPIIGSTTAIDGLSFAVGHGMWGLILAPVSARLVLDEIEHGRGTAHGGDAQRLLSPDRFTRAAA